MSGIHNAIPVVETSKVGGNYGQPPKGLLTAVIPHNVLRPTVSGQRLTLA